MSDEIEPHIPEIEPTAVYGPDDWRPYADNPAPEINIDHQRVIHDILDDLLYAAGSRTAHHTYDPNGAAEEVQRRMRVRHYAMGMQLMDPKTMIRGLGNG